MLLLSQLQANEKEHNTGLDLFLNRPTASFCYCCGAGINYDFSFCPYLELAPAKPGFRDFIPKQCFCSISGTYSYFLYALFLH